MTALTVSPGTPTEAEFLVQPSAETQAAPYRFSRSLVVLSNPASIQAEAIGDLRTHLLAQHISDKRRTLAVCAPSSDSGCTFVTANLAVAFALAGVRTLLIDANLRNPGLQNLIQPQSPIPGLRQCLADDLPLGDAIRNDVLPQLSVLYAGGTAENAQELLAGNRFKALIDNCIRDFDFMIVDTAPANTSADARRVSTLLRHTMIVTRRNMTYLSDVKTLVEELQADRSRVIGTFLNDY